MKYSFFVLSFLFFCTISCKDKPDNPEIYSGDTANTLENPYTGNFLYGSNMGWKNQYWEDEDVADILTGNPGRKWEGVGANSLRPALYYDFVQEWGYAAKVHTFKYYSGRGAKNNVLFIGDRPTEQHREKKQYIPGVPSESYENLYEPVWVGDKVNEKNYFAVYVYELVKKYKDYVKFWEIKNEPDFTYTECGWSAPGSSCSWWDKDPSPEELENFRAPVYSYIRMLRISYEVIKSVDPHAYICVGGIGYESFLDAILRNTDNPDNGKVTDNYPLKGGAWFDCLSFHIYPMYYIRSWTPQGWNLFRHSDAAVAAVENQTDTYVELLKKYGYGSQYPKKEMIISETNVPNKQIEDFIGSVVAQRNYLVKLAVAAQKKQIRGVYVFGPWNNNELNEHGATYDFMGFYLPLPDSPDGAGLRMNESGIAWRTASRLLGDRKYNEDETARLNLPPQIDGGAFYSAIYRDYVYVLWAKTTKDLSEEVSAAYSFPQSINVKEMTSIAWNQQETTINGNTVQLTGSPVFIKINPK